MQISNKFKIVWWAVLLLSLISLIYKRFDYITTDQIKPFDYIIFTLFIVLAILPFFSEMSMFGFKLKKEIKEEIKEVTNGIQDIRHLINNISNSNTIYLSSQPTLDDKQLEDLKKRLNIKDGISSSPTPENIENLYLKDKEYLISLFAIRYILEQEVKRIFRNNQSEEPLAVFSTRVLSRLTDLGIMDLNTYRAVREVFTISSAAMHGKELDKTQIDFALSAGAKLIEDLKNIS
ncbi:hypothetical protein KM925_25290 [Priestia megaterium]|uniref:hypothetical protein n=1 Tax=Priestia megaterium TaxID=1404 RepID=UPI001C2172F3|nr:hypothetical protein [Priestia megaterium]MBU8589212.1 hypothetical protein [Priestia megaterium]